MSDDADKRLHDIQNLAAGAYRRSGSCMHYMRVTMFLMLVVIAAVVFDVTFGIRSAIGFPDTPQKVELVSPKPTRVTLCAGAFDHWASTQVAYQQKLNALFDPHPKDTVIVRDKWIANCVAHPELKELPDPSYH